MDSPEPGTPAAAPEEEAAESDTPPAPAKRPNWFRRALFGFLGALVLVQGVILIRTPDYFANGALTGRLDRRGTPPPVVEQDGRQLLRAGRSAAFDITKFRLKPRNLRSNLGREHFPALLHPEFETAARAGEWLHDNEHVLVLQGEEGVKAYPLSLMHRHEVVNDTIDGEPVFAAYCILADLGAVYSRKIGGRTHSFALTGHVYYDHGVWDGNQAFVLWDRETESLWWPPIGRAVSGVMIDAPLQLYDPDRWAQMKWGEAKERFPDARVLKRGQGHQIPPEVDRYTTPPELSRQEKRLRYDPTTALWGAHGSGTK